MDPLFANKFSLSLGRQRKRSKINPLTNIFINPFTCLNRERFFGGCFWKIYKHLTFAPLLIWTKGDEMHTQNWRFNKNYLGKFFMPSTCLNREQKSQGISAKNLQKIKSLVSWKFKKRRTGYVKILNCNCNAQI